MGFSKISSYSSMSTENSSFFSNQKTHESLEKENNGTRTWTYINQPVEYRVIASDKKVIINSVKNKKKLEVNLVNDNARKVRNLLEKMDFLTSPISPIKPIMPIAPILFSFDDPKKNQNKLNTYQKKCQEKMADYQAKLADYEKKAKLYPLRKKDHEAARAAIPAREIGTD
jgi:hypothetical protein